MVATLSDRKEPLTVLLVEDNAADIMLMEEVIAEVKDDHSLNLIPVLVMSTSSSPQDVVRSYQLHANCFVRKPHDLETFSRVVKAIDHYWLEIVTLPPNR